MFNVEFQQDPGTAQGTLGFGRRAFGLKDSAEGGGIIQKRRQGSLKCGKRWENDGKITNQVVTMKKW